LKNIGKEARGFGWAEKTTKTQIKPPIPLALDREAAIAADGALHCCPWGINT
jgi:hypothetical protein